ncbi:hypothetical protein M378DRAFT_541863 [Amanita muscaria Koide BX008]|uniref:Methyltransferase n=1 Tax=Amanita muscaria (strain Koide BX008) TaxID=946122 RepID=A0A0C2TE42_AMAMK|nr:hypothetical protein M378DRAFT_541863 [Amanita muscaria Koide BX008]
MSDQISSVRATICYGVKPPDGSPAYTTVNVNPATGQRDRNYTFESKAVEIENLRGREGTVSLDTAGFQFGVRPSKHKSFTNDEEVKKEYYPECEELVKELTGATKVVIFDHTIRRVRPGELDDSPEKRQPVPMAHVDQTAAASVARVRKHVSPDEADELLKQRFQIINLWRPIEVPALEWPLALCDYRSVDQQNDMFPVKLIYPGGEGETLSIRYNPNHRWKYVRAMAPEEFVLIKSFDSVQDGSVAVFTPHTAFEDPTTPRGVSHRQSIELRTLVFYV